MITDHTAGSAKQTWEDPPLDEWEQAAAPESPAESRERLWHQWMMAAVGLTALMAILAFIIAVSALSSPPTQVITQTVPAPAAAGAGHGAGSAAIAMPAPQTVRLAIKADDEHGRMGPDGKWHDAYLPANFTVHAGAKVTVTVLNYDTSMHTFTSSTLSQSRLINEQIAAGSATSPRATTFTFTAPKTPGRYLWWCAMPCDPWAMAHIGYMRGYVTVAA